MTMVPVKISQPSLPWVVQRKKLSQLVDAKMTKPVVWISAPAGAGKTTFVSDYLAACNKPCLWYRCDEGDADPATFFYYMGRAAKKAAPRRRKSLPLLTPDYHPSAEAFARVYFEQLFSFMATRRAGDGNHSGWLMVLDNYQDVPPDAPLHRLIAIGLGMIPDGVHAFVISRHAPPQAMARLQARDRLASVHPMDLRFTYDESRELMLKRMPGLDPSAMQFMHEKTRGWAAGIALMLERERMGAGVTASAALFAHEKVFDYFAAEIFSRTEANVQDFLLKTVYLPVFSAVTAGALTGLPKVADILATMGRHHFFTEQVSENRPEYRFHPLFRDFLLSKSRDRFSVRQLTLIRKRAADILERSGHIEEAAKLFRDAADARNLCRLVTDHARDYLQQGRSKTLQEWIAGIPPATASDHPWVLYWAGMCAFPGDMPRAGKYLRMAFDRFQAAGDPAGIYLSWARVVDTYAFDLGEWKRLDNCIAVFDGLRKQFPDFPSPEIDLAASSRMLISLTLRKTDQPERVQAWLDRITHLMEENPSLDIQWDVYFCMSLYYLWKGEYHKNTVLLEKAVAQMRLRQPLPFAQIRIELMQGIHCWVTARYDAALDTLSRGLGIAEKSGVHVFNSMLWSFTAAAQMASGNVKGAKRALAHQMETLLESNKPQGNSAWTGRPCGWTAWCLRTGSRASANCRTSMPADFVER